MGNHNARVVEALRFPDQANVDQLQKIFQQTDKNKDGKVDAQEWESLLSDALWQALIEGGARELATEEKAAMSARAPKGESASLIATAIIGLGSQAGPQDKQAWQEQMFKECDVEHQGWVTFDQFVAFLKREGKAEKEQHKARIRHLITEGGGTLYSLPSEPSPRSISPSRPRSSSRTPQAKIPWTSGTSNLTVRTLAGKILSISEADASWSVATLKTKVSELEGLPAKRLNLYYEQRPLQDEDKLAGSGLSQNPELLLLILRLP